MPFDTMTTAAIADEVRTFAVGGRIQKIIQPSATSVALSVYNSGEQRWLLLSADPRFARVQLSTARLAKAFATPSPFIMLLRKHLEDARLAEVSQVPRERILEFSCRAGGRATRLIAEIMGKHSNVVLVDEAGIVLGAIKRVPPRQSRVRPILPLQRYHLPPTQERDPQLYPAGERVDPSRDSSSLRALLAAAPPDIPLRSALLGLLPGASPFLADQIAARAGVASAAPSREVDLDAVVSAATALYALYETHDWSPCIFRDARGRLDFAAFLPLGASEVRPVTSMSAAVEECLGSGESRDALAGVRSALLSDIGRARRAVDGKLSSLREGLEASAEADRVMQDGQLILAYAHTIAPSSVELSIPELERTIPLDPTLSPQENAERSFRRYRKLRDAQRRIPGLLAEAEAQVERLDDLAAFARLAGSEAELRELRRDLEPRGSEDSGKRPKRDKPKGPPRFRLDGYTALVGRNARENEEVTFRLARRDDLWLHARQRTGAHVVLQTGGAAPPDEIVQAAAQLAAHFSEGRTDTQVDVDSTLVRNVRKIPGGPPGRVTYQHFRTLRVEPRLEPWQAR